MKNVFQSFESFIPNHQRKFKSSIHNTFGKSSHLLVLAQGEKYEVPTEKWTHEKFSYLLFR